MHSGQLLSASRAASDLFPVGRTVLLAVVPCYQFSAVDGSGEHSNNLGPAGVFPHWCYHLRVFGWLPEPGTPEEFAYTLHTTFSGVALNDIGYLVERETGFEPATSTLARLHSTTELFPQHRNIYYKDRKSVNPIVRATIADQRVTRIGLRNGQTGQAVDPR
jgi:hypothetical protein